MNMKFSLNLFIILTCALVTTSSFSKKIEYLPDYLQSHGTKIINFEISKDNQLILESVLCSVKNICISEKLGLDLGDVNNNINKTTKEAMHLSEKEKKIKSIYINGRKVLKNIPIYFNSDSFRQSYIASKLITKKNYIVDFGLNKIYINPKRKIFKKAMIGSVLKYTGYKAYKFENYFYVKLSINGAAPVNFLIDNGASSSLIDTDYANKIGLPIDESKCDHGDSQVGKIKVCTTFGVTSIKSGKVRFGEILNSGFKTSKIRHFVIPPLGVEGILGQDWLTKNNVILAPEDSIMYIPDLR